MDANTDRLDRLYALLPAIHRMRDHERGEPLRALLQVMAEQLELVEDDIAQLYENWFIETCQPWVVPYIADLLGYESVAAGEQPARAGEGGLARSRLLAPRRAVANSVRYRRRKGTLAVLELLARDVAGWPARAVEFRRALAATADISGQSSVTTAAATVDIRAAGVLARAAGPFEALPRLPEVRRSRTTPGAVRHTPPGVGVYVWRLRAFAITRAPACCLEEVGAHWYTFSALGNDAPLFASGGADADPHASASELELPIMLGRHELAEGARDPRIAPAHYGLAAAGRPGTPAKSLAIWAPEWPARGPQGKQGSEEPLDRSRIIPADLSDFDYVPPRDHIAIDPRRGRIVFPPAQLPRRGVFVSYHYGFSAELGGGEYPRPISQVDAALVIRVRGADELREALAPWRARKNDDGQTSVPDDQPPHAVIEIADSGVYVVPLHITLRKGHSLQLRAAAGTRPLIRLLDWHTERPDSFTVAGAEEAGQAGQPGQAGEEGGRFVLDGVVVAGRGMRVEAGIASLTLRHVTLVPGWTLGPDCEPQRPSEPSLELTGAGICVTIERSIVGSIQVNVDPRAHDPVQLRIHDSIVDATGVDCDRPECEAIGAAGSERAHCSLELLRSTVIGRVMVHAIALAENAIFTGRVNVARRQLGCMRFCSLTPCSRTPRRFRCQPDLAEAAVAQAQRARERRRVEPRFTSLRYGTPGYCQLAGDCAPEIVRGADDESELGVFHDLFQPQRLASLTARIEEFVPAAADAAVIFVT